MENKAVKVKATAKTTTKTKEKVIKGAKKKDQKRGIPVVKTKLYEKPISLLPKYKCRACGHEWIPRTNQPLVCPVCHRRYV